RHTRFSRDWSSDVCSSDLYHKMYAAADVTSKTAVSESRETSADNTEMVVTTYSDGTVLREYPVEGHATKRAVTLGNESYWTVIRSEERRVGKGGRSGCAQE